ncbi:AAA family ATPase [Sulfidibacter corallicola]|uniref:AAA family ATPase n=1 Tax=Sulfidibacter corallicola TaxID=2818388 RepID=A0A8A4TH92_SULCO|nr:AAA family ATPase [Sulfidibacter corallicola]QTD48574.1 AAA family ATPase [Sulfidibacter corallicola]
MLNHIQPGDELDLDPMGTWRGTRHIFEKKAIWAIRAACAARRPLLIQGEPGCGKSQLARAVAQAMKWPFISTVIHHRSECTDLQWHFDAVARLGQAQLLSQPGVTVFSRNEGRSTTDDDGHIREVHSENEPPIREKRLAAEHFLAPGPLWWAVNWASARAQFRACDFGIQSQPPHVRHCLDKKLKEEAIQNLSDEPYAMHDRINPTGRVLLIDEIDKANADLPNGLLEVLDNGGFSIPYLSKGLVTPDKGRPLVIVTTNRERTLPPAFMRRCFVYTIKMDEDPEAFKSWLVARGRVHFGKYAHCHEEVLRECAHQLWKFRKEAISQGQGKPGQGEYLDLVRALMEIETDKEQQRKRLKDLVEFAFDKSQQVDL